MKISQNYGVYGGKMARYIYALIILTTFSAIADAQDKKNCEWVSSENVMNLNPKIDDTLSSLAEGHWYLSVLIEREFRRLSFCMISQSKLGKLAKQSLVNSPSYVDKEGRLVAFRSGDQIYMDRAFNPTNNTRHASLALRIAIHALIPEKTPQRNLKLQSMVSAIFAFVRGQSTAPKLAFQIENNGLMVPPTTEILEPWLADILTVASWSEGSDSELMSAYRLSKLPVEVKNVLNPTDLKTIDEGTLHLHQILQKAGEAENPATAQRIGGFLAAGLHPSDMGFALSKACSSSWFVGFMKKNKIWEQIQKTNQKCDAATVADRILNPYRSDINYEAAGPATSCDPYYTNTCVSGGYYDDLQKDKIHKVYQKYKACTVEYITKLRWQ